MSHPEPAIRVNVDVTNPGQFFACCGLLELADRLWPGAEGWFEEGVFCVSCEGTLKALIETFSQASIRSSLTSDQLTRLGTLLSAAKNKLTKSDLSEKADLQGKWKIERLFIPEPFDLWLDWWRDDHGNRTEMKTWAAKQMVAGMAKDMQSLIVRRFQTSPYDLDCLSNYEQDDSLAFNFDSGLSGAGAARDAGFSTDTLGLKANYCPLLELMAFVGLQRFKPAQIDVGTDEYTYSAWGFPAEVSIASAAASAHILTPSCRTYVFRLFSRSKYLKAFLPAKPVSRS